MNWSQQTTSVKTRASTPGFAGYRHKTNHREDNHGYAQKN